MILRKPYKFLIKHFKLIHLILTLLMVYVVYKFNYIFSFFNTTVENYVGIITTDATGSLYNIYIYLAIMLIIIVSLVLIGLLYFKKKPIKLYILNIIFYIFVTILIAYSYSVVSSMQLKIIDLKIIRNVRDFLILGYLLQIIPIILFGIRSLGFDIKKFDFKKDLEEFDISVDDNEEFELEFDIDTNKVHRKYNRSKRYLKYFYKENRYLFFVISSICIVILSFFIYFSFNIYTKKLDQNEYFKTTEFMMGVNNSYKTVNDYKGNIISKDSTFIILEISIKTNYLTELSLNLARPELIVGRNKFYHTTIYNDKFIDLGNTYQEQKISNEFSKYLLVYKIPNNLMSDDITFRYVDKNASTTKLESKSIDVKINVRNLDETKKTSEYKIGDVIDFSDSILGNTNFVLYDYDLNNVFDISYDFCIKDKCYSSIERLKPSILNNYDKTLLKINSLIVWDDDIASDRKEDVFRFLSMFGSFKYEVDGIEKTDFTTLKNVVSTRKKLNQTYYLEVIKEMIDANKIDLIIKVRDYTYIYNIK